MEIFSGFSFSKDMQRSTLFNAGRVLWRGHLRKKEAIGSSSGGNLEHTGIHCELPARFITGGRARCTAEGLSSIKTSCEALLPANVGVRSEQELEKNRKWEDDRKEFAKKKVMIPKNDPRALLRFFCAPRWRGRTRAHALQLKCMTLLT